MEGEGERLRGRRRGAGVDEAGVEDLGEAMGVVGGGQGWLWGVGSATRMMPARYVYHRLPPRK